MNFKLRYNELFLPIFPELKVLTIVRFANSMGDGFWPWKQSYIVKTREREIEIAKMHSQS